MRASLITGVLFCSATAYAVPGPDSVAIVANANDQESVALAERYRAIRQVPRSQLCALDLPSGDMLSLGDFRARFSAPLEACLGPAIDRIEALVLIRGIPLRVSMRIPEGETRVSLAAAAGLWRTTTSTGALLLGQPPGAMVNCGGTPCYGARVNNPFRRQGTFDPGWSRTIRGIEHRPVLVTMLHGYDYADAAKLIASATTAEAIGGARGEHLFMEGADAARGALDGTFLSAMNGLSQLGLTANRVPFDPDLVDRELASFVVGTAGLGATIEGNRFLPGALVDNLTSFGAVPGNFDLAQAESQVSIARWVARGVAGAHGTTDEPLNNVFPDRSFLVDYAEGGTLAEAYFRRLPFVYWHNLVLGDPMAAPYATRPIVEIQGIVPGEVIAGAKEIHVEAHDPMGRPLARLSLFVEGALVMQTAGEAFDFCIVPPVGSDQVLALAQVSDQMTPATEHRPKGWRGFDVVVGPGPDNCDPVPDAGFEDDATVVDAASVDAQEPDVSLDAGAVELGPGPMPVDSGCGCTATEERGGSSLALLLFLLLSRGRSRARARPSGSPRIS